MLFHVSAGTPTKARSWLMSARMLDAKSPPEMHTFPGEHTPVLSCTFPVLLLSLNPLGGAVLLSVNPLGGAVLFSGDPLTYIIAVAGKNNEVTIKSTNKMVVLFNVPFIMH